MSPQERGRSSAALKTLTKVIKALFWCCVAAEIAWLALSTAAAGALSTVLDAKDRGLAHLLILCALAVSSGLLILSETEG